MLAEHQARVRAEAAAAEAAREAAAAVRVQSAEASRKRQLCEIEAQVKAFSAAFKKQHGRSPKSADLESAANTRMKVKWLVLRLPKETCRSVPRTPAELMFFARGAEKFQAIKTAVVILPNLCAFVQRLAQLRTQRLG